MSAVHRIARIALAAPFVVLGIGAAMDPGPRTAAAEALGLPQPETMVRVNGVAMALGGVALGLNVLPRAASVGLIAALAPTTVAGHAFWSFDDEAQRSAQRIQFLKNLGLAGGLLAVASTRRR